MNSRSMSTKLAYDLLVFLLLVVVFAAACSTAGEPPTDDSIVVHQEEAYDAQEHFEAIEEKFRAWDEFVIDGDDVGREDLLTAKLNELRVLEKEYNVVVDYDDESWEAAARLRRAELPLRMAETLRQEGAEYDGKAATLEDEGRQRLGEFLWWAAEEGVDNEWMDGGVLTVAEFDAKLLNEWWEEFPEQAVSSLQRFERRCHDGVVRACGEAARMYRRGVYVMEDEERKDEFYGIACRGGLVEPGARFEDDAWRATRETTAEEKGGESQAKRAFVAIQEKFDEQFEKWLQEKFDELMGELRRMEAEDVDERLTYLEDTSQEILPFVEAYGELIRAHCDDEWTMAARFQKGEIVSRWGTVEKRIESRYLLNLPPETAWEYSNFSTPVWWYAKEAAADLYEEILDFTVGNEEGLGGWSGKAMDRLTELKPQRVHQWFHENPEMVEVAVRHREARCDDGVAARCVDLGEMYHKEEFIARDLDRAKSLFAEACTLDEGRCSSLGMLYAEGEGGDRDLARAVELFEKACAERDARGCHPLAGYYQEGRGVERDDTRAQELFEKACLGGHQMACFRGER